MTVSESPFNKHLQTTASVNSRVVVFQESLALPLKWNALTFGIPWQHTHSNLVGIFLQFWQLHHSWELILLYWVSVSSWLQLRGVVLVNTGSNWKPRIVSSIFSREFFPNFGIKILVLCSAKSLWNFYHSLFCSQLVYTCSKFGIELFYEMLF